MRIASFVILVSLAGCGSAVEVEGQPFELYTHCGLDRSLIEFDGSFWEARGPGPLSDGSGNPPAGFGNPFLRGTIARTGDDSAAYVSSGGVRVVLVRLDRRPDLEPCR
jgi:hypothetical protein